MEDRYLFVCLQHINQLTPEENEIALKVLDQCKVNKAILGYSVNEEENLWPDSFAVFKNSGMDCNLFVEYPLLHTKQFKNCSAEKLDRFFNRHEIWSNYPYETPALGVFTPRHEFNVELPTFLAKNQIRFGTSPSHFIDTKLKAKLKAPLLNVRWSSFWGRRDLTKNMDRWIEEAHRFPYLRISLFLNDLMHPRITELFTELLTQGLSDFRRANAEDLKQLIELELKEKQDKS